MLKIIVKYYKNDQTLILRLVNAVCFSGLIFVRHFVAIFGVRYNHPVCISRYFFSCVIIFYNDRNDIVYNLTVSYASIKPIFPTFYVRISGHFQL